MVSDGQMSRGNNVQREESTSMTLSNRLKNSAAMDKKSNRSRRVHSSAAEPDDETTSSDETSSSGSDSDSEDASDEEAEEKKVRDAATSGTGNANNEMPRIPVPQKPSFRFTRGDSDLRTRLSAFLPAMKAANEDLEKSVAAGNGGDMIMDDMDEEGGKPYIEMNLGLGVLEQKGSGPESSDEEEDIDGDESKDGGQNGEKSTKQGDTNVLRKLMGNKSTSNPQKPGIEEIGPG